MSFCSLRLIAPVIKDHGIDYERGKFQDKLNDGSLTLEHTRVCFFVFVFVCFVVVVASASFHIFIIIIIITKIFLLLLQQWIRKTISREPASMVDDLVAGKADAFVSVHMTSMFYLISQLQPIKTETMPETLLLDAHRLSQLQNQFNSIVDNATALTIAAHHIIGNDKKTPSAGKRNVMADLVSRMVATGGGENVVVVFDATELCSSLDSEGVLVDKASRDKLLKALALSVGNKEDAVRQLMWVLLVINFMFFLLLLLLLLFISTTTIIICLIIIIIPATTTAPRASAPSGWTTCARSRPSSTPISSPPLARSSPPSKPLPSSSSTSPT
jgi:hypothetical protein